VGELTESTRTDQPRLPSLLLGVDLEDVRDRMPGGERYPERVPAMTHRLLTFFERHRARTTFFVVGDVARRYRGLLGEIRAAGHELGWHTDEHLCLDRQTPRTFRDDLRRGLDLLADAGAGRVQGFRAPVLSLTRATSWAYDALAEAGFRYSSSVMPCRHPVYGWPGFGQHPRRVGQVWELPLSLLPGTPLGFAAGIYLRALPGWAIRAAAWQHGRIANPGTARAPIVGYVHPYDLDAEQDRFRQPGTEGSLFYHYLMYYNRNSVLPKVESLLRAGHRVETYASYLDRLEAAA
jgi:polysaccharide deacetylase family protein (PEP-CTERM system associated)